MIRYKILMIYGIFGPNKLDYINPQGGETYKELSIQRLLGSEEVETHYQKIYPSGINAATFFEMSASINPFDIALNVAIDIDTRHTLSWSANLSDNINTYRHVMVGNIKIKAKVCFPRDRELKKGAPPDSAARRLNLGLMGWLHREINYPDNDLIRDIARGMDISGEVPISGNLRDKETNPTLTLRKLGNNIRPNNDKIANGLYKTSNSETSRKGWQTTIDEAENGWLGPLGVVSERLLDETLITPRFCIKEQHGNQDVAYRVIGDLKRSKLNDNLKQWDTYFPEAIERFFAIAREMGEITKEKPLEWAGDFHKAYNNVALSQQSVKYAVVGVFNPEDGKVYAFRLKVLPFGGARPPAKWGRVAKFAQTTLMKILKIATGCFVDDLYNCEAESTAVSPFTTARELIKLLGLQLSPKKDQGPSNKITLLGAEIEIHYESTHVSISERRAGSICGLLDTMIDRGGMSSGMAAKIRGKLGLPLH